MKSKLKGNNQNSDSILKSSADGGLLLAFGLKSTLKTKGLYASGQTLIALFILLLVNLTANGQISIRPYQTLHFGDVTWGQNTNTGGSVKISFDGMRSTTGNIIALNSGTPATPAVFHIQSEQNERSLISFNYKTGNIVLLGTNGATLNMELDVSSEGDSGELVTLDRCCPMHTYLRIGAILHIGPMHQNPPGLYRGVFYVVVNNQ